MFAACPRKARIASGTDAVDVASIVTTERPIGVVVPNEDGRVAPLTASLSCAKAAALTLCRGESVWNDELSEETSTWR